MTDNSFEQTSNTRYSGVGPGRLVSEARAAQNLSQEELAAQIKLSRATLDAIERDDLSNLTEPVYVRGYYRRIAKVLHLSEEQLLSSYESIAPQATPKPSPAKTILSTDREVQGSDGISWNKALLIGGGIVSLIIAGLALYWNLRGSDVGISAPTVVVTPTTTTPVNTPAPTVSTPPAPVVNAPEATVPAAPAVTTPDANTPAVAPVDPNAAASTPAAVPGTAKIALQFTKQCWAHIKDVNGKTMVKELFSEGKSVELEGKPPFTVSLGNAYGVTMTFDGTPVDMSKFIKNGGTACFRLP